MTIFLDAAIITTMIGIFLTLTIAIIHAAFRIGKLTQTIEGTNDRIIAMDKNINGRLSRLERLSDGISMACPVVKKVHDSLNEGF